MSAQGPDNPRLRPFLHLSGGERLFALVMTKCAKPFGITPDSPEGPTLFAKIAEFYELNSDIPEAAFIAGLWSTLVPHKKIDFNLLPTLKELESTGQRNIATITTHNLVTRGAKYVLKQSYGIISTKDGKSSPVAYFSAQRSGGKEIIYRKFPYGTTDFDKYLEQSYEEYQRYELRIMNPVDHTRRILRAPQHPILTISPDSIN